MGDDTRPRPRPRRRRRRRIIPTLYIYWRTLQFTYGNNNRRVVVGVFLTTEPLAAATVYGIYRGHIHTLTTWMLFGSLVPPISMDDDTELVTGAYRYVPVVGRWCFPLLPKTDGNE